MAYIDGKKSEKRNGDERKVENREVERKGFIDSLWF